MASAYSPGGVHRSPRQQGRSLIRPAVSGIVEGMRESVDRRDVFAMAVLGLIGIGIPLWLAKTAGAIGLPTIDDWVYMRGADSLFRTGILDIPGHTAAAIGQLLMVQPFLWMSGGDPWGFTAFGLVMTLIGIVATYLLARRFVGTGSAVMVVLLVEAFPGFARESASFMTDVPAYALAVLCLLLGTAWLEGGRRRTLAASLGVGLLAVSVREFAIAAPAAVLVVSWARSRVGDRAWLVGASGIFAAGIAGVFIATALIPGRAVPATAGGLGRMILLAPAFVTLSAVLLPALALAIGRRMPTLTPTQIFLGAGLAGLAFFQPWGSWPGGGGNLWTPTGLVGDGLLLGFRDTVISDRAWALSVQVASFAAMLLATLAFRWGQHNLTRVSSFSTARTLLTQIARSPVGLLLLFMVAYAAELIGFASVYGIWDRYLYLLVPAAAILLLRGRDQPSQFGRTLAFSHAAFVWLAVSAFVIAANSFAYDAARWREGEAAVAMGYSAGTVDAGYEWVGYHAVGVGAPEDGDRGRGWFEVLMWPNPVCAELWNSPLDGNAPRLIRVNRTAYLQYLFFGPAEPLYLYGVETDACPQLPPAVVQERVR